MIKSINPATLEVNAEIQTTPVDRIPSIVSHARVVQKNIWGPLDFSERLEYIMSAKEYVLENIDEIARVITLDNGKPLMEAVNAEIYPVLDMFRFCASEAREALEEEKLRNPVFTIARIKASNIFQPVGVVGIISPWNFPFGIPATQILMALISGNTVVFKPSALTALVGEEIKKIFESSGLPEGVLNVIQGSGSSVGDTLMGSGLNHVVFTGSVPVGKQLMAQAAQTLTSITLELGGKDPFIVLKDANIDRAAAAAVWGAFVNAGQVCTSVERVYVDKKVADKFTNKVLERTRKLRVGNGLRPDVDMGPMISEDRITLVEAHLADAVAKGAKILCGGKRMANLPGYFFEPTVLSETNHEMDCIREETFGPTLPIMVFSDEEEAIELANDNRYGLHASVWSRDTKRARRLGEKIEAGTVIINNCLFTYGFSECPWGGVKDSGIGRTHSVHGLREFANLKNITVNEALLKEDPWWYPYSQVKYDLTKTAFKAMFCGGMACRGKAVTEAVQAFGKRRKKKS